MSFNIFLDRVGGFHLVTALDPSAVVLIGVGHGEVYGLVLGCLLGHLVDAEENAVFLKIFLCEVNADYLRRVYIRLLVVAT